MKSNFELVSELNEAFGNPKGDILTPNVKAIRKQAKLVFEEAIELMEAAHPGSEIFWQWDITAGDPAKAEGVNMKEVLDAQGDITTVNDGVAHIVGFDSNLVLRRVDKSNRSKFIETLDQVSDALAYYYALGFDHTMLRVEGEFPLACIKVTRDVVIEGKEYPEGKFLKNMATFKEPDFSDILVGEQNFFNKIIAVGNPLFNLAAPGFAEAIERGFYPVSDTAMHDLHDLVYGCGAVGLVNKVYSGETLLFADVVIHISGHENGAFNGVWLTGHVANQDTVDSWVADPRKIQLDLPVQLLRF